MKNNKLFYLKRLETDEKIKSLTNFEFFPEEGWIQRTRKILGIKARQIGKKIGCNTALISSFEKRELEKTITIKNLERIANAMDCDFVYAFVPKKKSYEDTFREQCKKASDYYHKQSNLQMALEDQAVENKKMKSLTKFTENDFYQKMDSAIWEIDE